MVNTRKGQVSLEYLMTYGIAIAIVVIAIAALYSMGVFAPSSSSVPCSPCFANFAYIDYSETAGELVLKNGPKALTNVTCGNGNFTGNTIAANEQFSITNIPHDPIANKTIVVTMTYDYAMSGLQHIDTATIHN